MTSDLLTPLEVVELTGKRKHKAQARALARMGVPSIARLYTGLGLARRGKETPER